MPDFTLAAGAIYAITLVPLINGNPDGEAVLNGTPSISGGPEVRQLTEDTPVAGDYTAPAGTWVVDLSSSSDGQSVNVSASANYTWADNFTGQVSESATVTVGGGSSNTHGLGLQIGPAS